MFFDQLLFQSNIIRYFQCFHFTSHMSRPYYLLKQFTNIIKNAYINSKHLNFVQGCACFYVAILNLPSRREVGRPV